ncbi:D-alanyl-D-alanine carboxypeptidase (plasmid) [Sinorhizobium fredii CCBAU 83666]|nr:D-alanyl-D-alanine carboxypeptidase [Sinorhizobium fredii CCBAU 83666]ASY73740.1 D-alanyl-D-alanine carboxypeptidase [Sinorhizobium fredii CCBAU 83666]ASY73741.1 D-alanyl-D-alanine carboxypeptidase [Sinorhizobium fredii CCBAU 83666]ASY73742.1 D-alanyl-D-alanine carboxypeptidase [Sinorhizobium fredii CCBAU 83666]ASY73743.1 D-alanyl-D-alanine carboxypeptidase [Sinorhizobium fredii CCBAU 83666]
MVMCDHTKKAAHMEASDPVKNICRKHLQAGAVHIWKLMTSGESYRQVEGQAQTS